MNLHDNRKAVFEGSDQTAYRTFKQEITRYQASSLRLDSIVNAGIFAGANMLKNSVSLNRLNALSMALKDCKENSRLSRLSRVPAYLKLENCIAFNKEHSVFIITDYAACKAACQCLSIPTVHFLQWCKENKPSKESTPLTEKQAAQKIRTLYIAMRDSVYVSDNPQFQTILTALNEYVETMNKDYQASLELEKMRNIINI